MSAEGSSPKGSGLNSRSAGNPRFTGLRKIARKTLSSVAFSYGINTLLECYAEADQALSELLSVCLAKDAQCAQYLLEHVLDCMTFDRKISLLDRIIQDNGSIKDFPNVTTVLTSLRNQRNRIAHSYADPAAGRDAADYTIVRKAYRKGKEQTLKISVGDLMDLIEEVFLAIGHLGEMKRRATTRST